MGTIYGFLVDTALFNPDEIDLTDSTDRGVGYLNDNLVNYLRETGKIKDGRATRLQLFGSEPLSGKLFFMFDRNRVDDISVVSGLTKTNLTKIFNIIERVVYSGSLLTEQIEDVLTSDTTYKGYVASSLVTGTKLTSVPIRSNTETPIDVEIRDWFKFTFQATSSEVTFHIWLNSEAFSNDYPYTTITKVICPHKPENLLDPASLLRTASIPTLIAGSMFSLGETNVEVHRTDHNGVYVYPTKYVVGPKSEFSLPFGLMYCGAKPPSSVESRIAIREYLLSLNIVTAERLEEIFPELFVGSRFFVIPLWDYNVMRPSLDIFPSIINPKIIDAKTKKIFPNIDDTFRGDHTELLTQSHDTMWITSLPDPANEKYFSIFAQHPSYRSYSSHDPAFGVMDAITQDFSRKLSLCIAVLNNQQTSDEFVISDIDGSQYLTFISKYSEYHVMSKQSYQNLMK